MCGFGVARCICHLPELGSDGENCHSLSTDVLKNADILNWYHKLIHGYIIRTKNLTICSTAQEKFQGES